MTEDRQLESTSIDLKDRKGIAAALGLRGINLGGDVPRGPLIVESPCSLGQTMTYGAVSLGAYSFTGAGSELRQVEIGRFCSIARRVVIGSVDHPMDGVSTHPIAWGSGAAFRGDDWFMEVQAKRRRPWRNEPVTIGNDVWIGNGVFIRRGVRVGDGAVIGAGSIVTRDVAPYDVVAGVPAKSIRRRFPAEIADRLQATRWWDMDLRGASIDLSDVETALPALEKLAARGSAALRRPRWHLRPDRATRALHIELMPDDAVT